MINQTIAEGKAILGIEFGSTRIKSVLIDEDHHVIASGSHEWENEFRDGIWTYSEKAIMSGLQLSYADLKANVMNEYGLKLQKIAALGISAMMHGYLPFNEKMELLVPFRTWRNTAYHCIHRASLITELVVQYELRHHKRRAEHDYP